MLGLQLGNGMELGEHSPCSCMHRAHRKKAITTTLHVQVPVLDVELLCLKCQASRMSLKSREGESEIDRLCRS